MERATLGAATQPGQGGGCGRRRRPVALARCASLSPPRPPSASLAASAPRRAGVQFQRGDERRLRGAPRGKKATRWRGLGSGRRRGRARVEAPPPKGSPGSRAAAEGNRDAPGGRPRAVPAPLWRAGRVWVASRPRAARPALRSSSLCLPGPVEARRVRVRAGAESLAATRCQFSSPPQPPLPRQTFARGGHGLGHPGESFSKLEGKGRGEAAPPPQTPGRAPKLVRQVQRPPPSHSRPSLGGGNPSRA